MKLNRWIVATVILVLGALMAWDSNVLTAVPYVKGLVAIAIFLPAAAGLLSGCYWIHGGAVFLSLILLIVARASSGIELRWYAMAFIFFILLLGSWSYERRLTSSKNR